MPAVSSSAAAGPAARRLAWDGCFNVRDLGGLPTVDGRETRLGAVVRSDACDRLSPSGWATLRGYGVRTIVDLRDPAERRRPAGSDPVAGAADLDPDSRHHAERSLGGGEPTGREPVGMSPGRRTAGGEPAAFEPGGAHAARPESARGPLAGIESVHVPVLDLADDGFWGEGRWRGREHSSPFYLALLERWPERIADAVRQIARARPGAVVVHCQAGRDRAGLVAAAVLTLAGVEAEAIVADYAASAACLQPLYEDWAAAAADESERRRILRANSSEPEAMAEVLAAVELEGYLRAHGLAAGDVERLRARLLGSPKASSMAGAIAGRIEKE